MTDPTNKPRLTIAKWPTRLGLNARWGWLALAGAAVALISAASFLLFSFPLETVTLTLFILGVLLLERG